MNLYEENSDRLILDMSQWGWRLRGLLLMLVGLISFIYVHVHYRIDCLQKSPGSALGCTLKSMAYGFQLTRTPLGTLMGASVLYEGREDNTADKLYIIKLKTSGGLVKLSDGPSAGFNDKEKTANAINEYISQGLNQRFQVPYSSLSQLIMQMIFFVFFLIGLLLFLGIKHVHVIVDRSTKEIIITWKSWFSKTEKHIPWSEVVQFNTQEMNFSFRSRATLGRIVLLLSNMQTLPLSRVYSYGCTKMRMTVTKINSFLASTPKNEKPE